MTTLTSQKVAIELMGLDDLWHYGGRNLLGLAVYDDFPWEITTIALADGPNAENVFSFMYVAAAAYHALGLTSDEPIAEAKVDPSGVSWLLHEALEPDRALIVEEAGFLMEPEPIPEVIRKRTEELIEAGELQAGEVSAAQFQLAQIRSQPSEEILAGQRQVPARVLLVNRDLHGLGKEILWPDNDSR